MTQCTNTVMLVLKSGGEFKVSHVLDLIKQIGPNYKVKVLSDVLIEGVETIPLQYDWPGWFSKMELFRPDIKGDFLYVDLDTIIISQDLDQFFQYSKSAMLSDFYFPERPASGVMFLKEEDRKLVWDKWIKNPAQNIKYCGVYGDQKFIGEVIPHSARFKWPDIVSYKAHIRFPNQGKFEKGNGSVPKGAKIICFHGKPRPWELAYAQRIELRS